MTYVNDIETALYERLAEDEYSASAHTVPADLGSSLPHVHVVRTGGDESDIVLESHRVDFDVYHSDPTSAMETANQLCGWVRELPGTTVGTVCYQAKILTLPYNNPDPRHYSLFRVTFKAQILTRTKGA